MKGNEEQFRRMFRLSRYVFEAVLQELSPYLQDGNSRNNQENLSARLKLGVALYYMAHGGDAIHLEAGSAKATALKYVHQVADLICTHLKQKWMGEALLTKDKYMDGCRERFRLRNGFPLVGAAIDGTHIPYKPNSEESEQSYKNYKMWTSMLCIGMGNSCHMFVDMDVGWPGRLHNKTWNLVPPTSFHIFCKLESSLSVSDMTSDMISSFALFSPTCVLMQTSC